MRKRISTVEFARAAVWDRSKGRCEKCGRSLNIGSYECHHRKLRSQGGDWSICNLLALHQSCHTGATGSVHDRPAESYDHGYLVRGAHDPAETPVLLHGRRWVLLTPEGTYETVKGEPS